MDLVVLAFSLLNADIHANVSDTMLLILQRMLKFFLIIFWLLLAPFLKLRYFTKPKQLPEIRNKLLFLSATEIAQQIRKRQISCREIIEAYVERCKAVNPILNAIVEARFEAALQEAIEADAFLKSTTKTEDELAREMPLLGVPVSVKESIAVKGMSYSVGLKEPNPCKATEDAAVVKMIRKAGGIITLVSNTPELCLFYETFNKVTGTTRNPYDTRRTAGGSSGGEAALLGSGAAVLSLASDIAGSARLPAMFCGVYGHKPSPGLVPFHGHKPEAADKRWPNFFTICPMVRYAADLPLLLNVMTQSTGVQHSLGQKVSLTDINFFFLEDCGSYMSISVDREIKLAIRKVKKHLETRHGVEVQKAKLNQLKFAFNIASRELLSLKGIETIFSKEENSKKRKSVPIEVLKFLFFMSPHTLPPMLFELVKYATDKLPNGYHKQMSKKLSLLRKEYEDLLGNNGVLIQPTFVTSAYYLYESYYYIGNIHYLMIYNALGYPVTQCATGLNSKGLPIGLQIIASPGCDHLSIAAAQEIEKIFGGWQPPSHGKTV